jgi:hypothetical protein
MPAAANAALVSVLAHPAIWRGGDCAPEPSAMPSGFPELDAVLPGRGWPQAALTEVLLAREGIGEIRLTLPALARLQAGRRDVVWIAPPHLPYAPALAAAGLDLARLLIVRCHGVAEELWAYEQALRLVALRSAVGAHDDARCAGSPSPRAKPHVGCCAASGQRHRDGRAAALSLAAVARGAGAETPRRRRRAPVLIDLKRPGSTFASSQLPSRSRKNRAWPFPLTDSDDDLSSPILHDAATTPVGPPASPPARSFAGHFVAARTSFFPDQGHVNPT